MELMNGPERGWRSKTSLCKILSTLAQSLVYIRYSLANFPHCLFFYTLNTGSKILSLSPLGFRHLFLALLHFID